MSFGSVFILVMEWVLVTGALYGFLAGFFQNGFERNLLEAFGLSEREE